jgi:pSer/pThr/pTyr-binding forkhead associated (FHA) protein
LRDGENVVGRVDADVLLPDLTVSRVHARLTLTGTMLMVEDANSTNGSKVDGSRLQPGTPVRLADGSQVQFGQVALRVDGLGGDKPIDETGRPAGSGVFIDADAFKTPEEPEVARLVAMSGAKSYPIYSYPASVGRRADNAVVIADPFISGRHAEIIQTPEGIVVRDLGSTNGTIIGSEPLLPDDSAAIRPGTIVQFGKQRFQFVVPESGAGTGSPSVLGSEANGSETSSPADDETDSQTVLPSNPPTPPGTDPVPPVQDTSGEHNVQ